MSDHPFDLKGSEHQIMIKDRISNTYPDEHYTFRLTSIDGFYGAVAQNAECFTEVGARLVWLMDYHPFFCQAICIDNSDPHR